MKLSLPIFLAILSVAATLAGQSAILAAENAGPSKDDYIAPGGASGRSNAPPISEARPVQSGQRTPQQLLASLKTVDPAIVRAGWSVDTFLDKGVLGKDGASMGEVQDLVFAENGTLTDVMVEGGGVLGGLLDVGDATFRAPWSNVSLSDGKLHLPFDKKAAQDQGLLNKPEKVAVHKGEFLASQMIRHDVFIPAAQIHGVVADLIVGPDTHIDAVLVERTSLRRCRASVDSLSKSWRTPSGQRHCRYSADRNRSEKQSSA